jgi:hypothetical protein
MPFINMPNLNQHNTSVDFVFSIYQLNEVISTKDKKAISNNWKKCDDFDELIEVDELELEKLYLCL